MHQQKLSVGALASSRGSVGPFASPRGPLCMSQHGGCHIPNRKEKAFPGAALVPSDPHSRPVWKELVKDTSSWGHRRSWVNFVPHRGRSGQLRASQRNHFELWITLNHTDPKSPQSQWKRPGLEPGGACLEHTWLSTHCSGFSLPWSRGHCTPIPNWLDTPVPSERG